MALLLLSLFACSRATLQVRDPGAPPVQAAIVPGCPSEDDGRLSFCQWRRVLWARQVWASGLADTLIVSGNAVYNRYVEAEALRAGLVALGVPPDRILLEPRALHTDENIAYALRIAKAHGFEHLAVASDGIQTQGTCDMVQTWSEGTVTCVAAPMDCRLIHARLAMGLPDVRTEPVPEDEWLPLKEREARIAQELGTRPRGNSLVIYATHALLRPFGLAKPPVLPP